MASAAGWVTFLMGLSGVYYAVAFANDAHRLGVGISACVAAATGAIALWCVPWWRVVTSPHRQSVFVGWSILIIVMIGAISALDGGAQSPISFMLFLPTVFASLAYPPRLVLAVSILVQTTFAALVLVAAPDPGHIAAFSSALIATSVLAVWQANNHDAWRAELARSSSIDPLTELPNRRGLALAADASLRSCTRHSHPMTLLILDLDLFKAYNDTHGHHGGDELLRWVGAQLRAAARPQDTVARLGGDEFVLVLPNTTAEAAKPVIALIENALSPRAPYCLGSATAPKDGTTFDALYRASDRDLYQRKSRRPTTSAYTVATRPIRLAAGAPRL